MSRILVADDHDALRRGLALALRTAGHDVEEAPNGNAAIERLHNGYFDVVVSDLRMGGSDGLDVLRTTRTTHPTSSVILMTAFGSVSTAVEAMKTIRPSAARSKYLMSWGVSVRVVAGPPSIPARYRLDAPLDSARKTMLPLSAAQRRPAISPMKPGASSTASPDPT